MRVELEGEEEELGLLGQERRASGELEVLEKLHRTRPPAAPGHGRLRDRPEGKQKFLQAAPGQRSLLPVRVIGLTPQ